MPGRRHRLKDQTLTDTRYVPAHTNKPMSNALLMPAAPREKTNQQWPEASNSCSQSSDPLKNLAQGGGVFLQVHTSQSRQITFIPLVGSDIYIYRERLFSIGHFCHNLTFTKCMFCFQCKIQVLTKDVNVHHQKNQISLIIE